jgi:hypothetical protein
MKEELLTDGLLRKFLLGELDDDERERVERLFITDRLSRDRVLTAEQDLIEDYLENSLTTADREKFLLHYGQTPLQKRKLRIAKSIQEWAVAEANVPRTIVPSTTSIWGRWRDRLKPVFVIPITVTAIVAMMVGVVWINRRAERRNTEHSAVEQELAKLNAPESLREVPPQMVSLELAPVTVRNVERQGELVRSADIRVLELRLLWMRDQYYSTYQASVRRIGDDKSFTTRNLQAENDGKAIRIRLPASILSRGLYQIELIGITADGTASPAEEYSFTVRD